MSAARYPDAPAVIDELGHDLVRRARPPHERDRARAGRRTASAPAGLVAILCRNHRGFVEVDARRRRRPGANMLYLNTSFAGPQIADVCRVGVARSRSRTTTSSKASSPRRARPAPLRRCGRSSSRAAGTNGPLHAAGQAGPRRHPHERHDRRAEGRRAPSPDVARSRGGAAGHDPSARAGADADRRADVPLLGPRALQPRPDALDDARPAAASSTRSDARRAIAEHRVQALIVVPVMLAAPARRAARAQAASTTSRACGSSPRAARRCPATSPTRSWTSSATSSTTSTARPRSRGRRSRRPRTCASAPGTAGPPAARHAPAPLRRGGPSRCPRGGHGRIYVSQRDAVRGLHGRRRQGHDRRADVVRRRRAPRRATAACSSTAATTR